MALPIDPRDALHALRLWGAALLSPAAPPPSATRRALLVDVRAQRATLIEHDEPVRSWPVSTAAAGLGGREGSNRTPPGWHRIHRRIGAGAPRGAIFESREPTGEVWGGAEDQRDLILTRILTLQGLEPGVNHGPGVDSLERWIYLHGTNHEARLGQPVSHGCVRLSNPDVEDVFERMREGDPVAIVDAPALVPDPRGPGRFHYAGLGGSGMSALAQFQAMLGGRASGSDRSFDQGSRAASRGQLEALGIAIHPQDGSGIGPDCVALVLSTAVEAKVPDVARARELRVPILHRSDLLAHFVATRRTIAVSGTSGKSSVVAMTFEILRGAGRDPSVITGGDLLTLQREGLWGNAWAGGSDLLVIEADESDGSLVRYEPAVAVILNLQRDHHEESTVAAMFETFAARTREIVLAAEDANLTALAPGARRFGLGAEAATRGEAVELGPTGSTFTVGGAEFRLPVPGRHNVENALAAIAACEAVGVPLAAMAAPLARYEGVGRRFQSIGRARGVEVVDDFAHNPSKIEAALRTAQARAPRVLAVYQPHGYGPTRFLRPDFVRTFSKVQRAEDGVWWLEIFYAGGTATRDFSSADIVEEIAARGARAEFAPSRAWLAARIAEEAREGDLVLVMGARDPSLTAFAREILGAIERGAPAQRPGGAAPVAP